MLQYSGGGDWLITFDISVGEYVVRGGGQSNLTTIRSDSVVQR